MEKFFDLLNHHIVEMDGVDVPVIDVKLKRKIVEIPKEIDKASGIIIMGKRIRSLLFSTDVSIIKNTNADGIIAVYPFTSQVVINRAIMEVANVPVLVGVGGGTTQGERAISIAFDAEVNGAYGVVLNSPAPNELIVEMKKRTDIPIVVTVGSIHEDMEGRIRAGTSIFNISGGAETANIVRKVRENHPDFPIIATGGPTIESIRETIEAGANCITYTPPSTAEFFKDMMKRYREETAENRREVERSE